MNELERLRATGATVQEVKLERIKWAVIAKLDAADIEATVDIENSWIDEFVTIRVVGYVWGEALDRRIICYPANWIEAIKDRWLPYWIRRYWNVRFEKHYIEAKAYYPGIRPSMLNHEWRIAAYVRQQEEGAND